MGRLKYLVEDTTNEISELSDKWKDFFNKTYNDLFINNFEIFLNEHNIQDVFKNAIGSKESFYKELDPIDFLYYFRGINNELYKMNDTWITICKSLQKQYLK